MVREQEPVSQWTQLTIIAQDPSITLGGEIVTGGVRFLRRSWCRGHAVPASMSWTTTLARACSCCLP